MNNGITIAGNLIVDVLKIIDTYPKQGLLCNIMQTTRNIGGCAANTSADLAILDPGLPVVCLGRVGDDSDGRLICDTLAHLGIDISGIQVDPDRPTSYTDVMSVQTTGERTFFHARGANAAFGIDDIQFDALHTKLFHIGYALLLDSFDESDDEYGTVMARTLAQVQQLGIKTSMDVVSEASQRFEKIVKPCLKYCNYIILNEIESSMVTNIEARGADGDILHDNIRRICENMLAQGVADLVVIHAVEGGWAMAGNGDFYFEPSFRLPSDYIVGTVGAGDAFCAGILYALDRDMSAPEALELANACAACSLSSANSIGGLRPIQEVLQLRDQFPKRAFG
jgi:sugar/nucleoside kinase (ribokinase family)